MSRRTVGITVVLTVIGVAFVLEGWTFLDLLMMQFSDEQSERTVTSSDGAPELVAAGDRIQLDADGLVRIDDLYVHAGTSDWTFYLTVTVKNTGARSMTVKSRYVKLTSDETVDLEQSMTIPSEGSLTKTLSAKVPQGTEVTEWHLRWSRTQKNGNWNDQSVPLDKSPVRRRDE